MLTGNIVSKTGIVGRLIAVSAVGGLIAAAMALPVVATTGIVLRDQANKAAAPASATFGVLPQRSEIDDNSGHLLAYIYNVNGGQGASYSGIDREPVTFGQISPNMRKAVVAIEDNRYWSEGALDPKGTLRALINDLQHKAVQGGSSITQQYVKNVLILTAPNAQAAQQAYEETLSRKLHELRLAITVAHEQSKQEILAGYLNDAYFGNLAYGIDVAAQTYFGTSPDKLTLPQAAMLAGMVENPSGYDPYLHPADALTRRNIVLARMVQTGVLTSAEATAAEKTPLGVTHGMPEPGCNQEVAGDSAFFCNYVEQVFLQDTTVAKTAQARAKLLATGGLKIYTTLDPKDQKAAAEAVNYTLPYHSDTYNAFHEADTEVMVQPGTGRIEGMAENRPYGPGRHHDQLRRGHQLRRGPGHPDRFLVQAVHAGHRAGAEHAVRLHQHRAGQHHGAGFHQLQGAAPHPGIPGAERRELQQRVVHVLALHGDGPVDQRVLRRAGAEGRAVQRGQDGSQPGCHLGQRDPAAGRGAVRQAQRVGRQHHLVHPGLGRHLPAGHGRGLRDHGRARQVLQADRDQQDRQPDRRLAAGAVGRLLAGHLAADRGRGQLHPAGRAELPRRDRRRARAQRPAAGKTGTANNSFYAAFGGYTPDLAAYVSVYHPNPPESMTGAGACYHASGQGQACDSEMFGADAPGHTWQLSFEHANLGQGPGFVGVPADSQFNSQGDGQSVKQQGGGKGKGKGKGKGGGNGNGNGGTTACFFNFCTGGGNNGGGGGGNGGPPANATKTALITPSTTGVISPLALFAREE